MDMEQGPRGWAKGRVHASSSEANSAHPRRPWGPGTQESGSLLGGDRHHAAGAGTAPSDCQRRGACQWHDSPNYRGRAYQEKATGPMRLVQGDGKGTWKMDCRLRQEARRLYFPRPWRAGDLAMFNLAIDSKLRGCDVVALKVEDVAPKGYAVERATVRQKKTGQPVRFELTEQTRQALDEYIMAADRRPGEFLFPSRRKSDRSITTRQYARLVADWIASIGLDANRFGTHSLRRTKATLIYRRTGNLRAVQLLLGHTKIESTVRYLGIEVDDALAIAEQVDV